MGSLVNYYLSFTSSAWIETKEARVYKAQALSYEAKATKVRLKKNDTLEFGFAASTS